MALACSKQAVFSGITRSEDNPTKEFTHANIEEYLPRPWLQAQRYDGFAVNFRWKGAKHLVVHRATCPHIGRADVNYARKGDHSGKMWSSDIRELRAWAGGLGKRLDPCGHPGCAETRAGCL